MLSAGRPPVRCRNGVVASPHHLASLAGARVLLEGGNAVDAAVAADAVLTVVYPHNCTIGGDAFWLIYSAADGTLRALNGSGRAPRRANPAEFAARGLHELPYQGILTVTVPGVVDSWAEALARHGSLPLARVLAPAIQYAHDGFAVSDKLAEWFAEFRETLRGDPGAREVFLADGQPPRAGHVLRQPELGRTLEAIAQHGRDELYRGATARAIAAASRALGGLLEEEDLAAHHSDWVAPIQMKAIRTSRSPSAPCTRPPDQGMPVSLDTSVPTAQVTAIAAIIAPNTLSFML